MQQYQRSDAEAAAKLIDQLSPQIYQFYFAYVRDRQLAEDLLQDFWIRIHKARTTYRAGEPLLPWVYAIARRVRIDHYRRNRSRRHFEIQREQLPDRPAHQARTQAGPELPDVLSVLPPGQREIILLLKVSGLSLEETARATGTTVGAVRQKAHRAYEKLRKLFGSEP
jgi:RNA polymerase sigma-70 factor (ECF subfamily)